MEKKKPERTCIVCRKKSDKSNFIKMVKNKDGQIQIEKEKKLDGRGAYICGSPECITKCIKTRALNKIFKCSVGDNVYEELNGESR